MVEIAQKPSSSAALASSAVPWMTSWYRSALRPIGRSASRSSSLAAGITG